MTSIGFNPAKNVLTPVEYLAVRVFVSPGRPTRFYAEHLASYWNPRIWNLSNQEHTYRLFKKATEHYFDKEDFFFNDQPQDFGPSEKKAWILIGGAEDTILSALNKIGLDYNEVVTQNRPPRTFARQLLNEVSLKNGMTRSDMKSFYDRISNASPRHSSLHLSSIISQYCDVSEPVRATGTGFFSQFCKLKKSVEESMMSDFLRRAELKRDNCLSI